MKTRSAPGSPEGRLARVLRRNEFGASARRAACPRPRRRRVPSPCAFRSDGTEAIGDEASEFVCAGPGALRPLPPRPPPPASVPGPSLPPARHRPDRRGFDRISPGGSGLTGALRGDGRGRPLSQVDPDRVEPTPGGCGVGRRTVEQATPLCLDADTSPVCLRGSDPFAFPDPFAFRGRGRRECAPASRESHRSAA
jgi:hypothetical protein